MSTKPKAPKSKAAMMKRLRQERKAKGLVHVCVDVTPEMRDRLKRVIEDSIVEKGESDARD